MDLFSKALLKYHCGQSDALIRIIRNDGWEDAHSPSLYFTDEPFTFERPALAHIDGPTVDIGCGAGRHLRCLGSNGYDAFGLDISEGAIEVCRLQGLKNVAQCDVMTGAMPDLPFQPRNLTLFGNNVGIGGTFDGSVRLLKNLRQICSPGGRLMLTGINVRETETPEHLDYQEANLAAGRRRGEIKIRLLYEDDAGPEFAWFHPEPNEIEELALLSDWQVERLELMGAFFWAVLRRD